MSDICILSDDNHRNVFDEKLLINSREKDTHEELDEYMTLRDAIELIIGCTTKYNPRVKQHSWHYVKSACSKKNTNEDYNKRSISSLSKRSEHYGLKRKSRFFLSFQKASSTKTKKLVERKLTLWEYVFGPKRSSKDPCACQLADHQEQTCFQVIPGDVLNYTDSVKSSKNSSRLVDRNPLPKPPPSYKLPTAVLLRTTMESIAEKGDYEVKMVTPSRKLYEEMRPASNTRGTERTKDVKPYEKSISCHVATAEILRQAMSQEEPRMHSRIERLKILVNEKMAKPQRMPRIDPECKNSDG